MLFDFMDGKVARWRKETSMLGQELDSLADSVSWNDSEALRLADHRSPMQLSFGVAPAFLGFAIGLRSTADIIALTAFICCGIARLARFNATVALLPKDSTGKASYFEGLPIPSSLVLVGCMALCVYTGHYEVFGDASKGLPGGLILPLVNTPLEMHWLSFIFGTWAALMISKTLHIPKP
jgi:CDP-diacylglycerol--serine O-phosphatidyltransferase